MCLSVVEVIVTDDDSLSTQEQNIWKNSALYQRSATLSGCATGARAESFISNKATHLHSIDNWGTQVHWVIFHFSEQTIKDQFKYIAYHFLVQTQSVNTKQTNVRTPTKCSASSTVWEMGNKGLDIWNHTTVPGQVRSLGRVKEKKKTIFREHWATKMVWHHERQEHLRNAEGWILPREAATHIWCAHTGRQRSHFLSFQCCQFTSGENMLNLETSHSADII